MINITVVNSILIFKKLYPCHKRITLPMFKIIPARELLQSAVIPDYPKAGGKRSFPTPDRLRGKYGHLLELNPPTKSSFHYKRCVIFLKNGQRKETKYQCDKCETSLCPSPSLKITTQKENFSPMINFSLNAIIKLLCVFIEFA